MISQPDSENFHVTSSICVSQFDIIVPTDELSSFYSVGGRENEKSTSILESFTERNNKILDLNQKISKKRTSIWHQTHKKGLGSELSRPTLMHKNNMFLADSTVKPTDIKVPLPFNGDMCIKPLHLDLSCLAQNPANHPEHASFEKEGKEFRQNSLPYQSKVLMLYMKRTSSKEISLERLLILFHPMLHHLSVTESNHLLKEKLSRGLVHIGNPAAIMHTDLIEGFTRTPAAITQEVHDSEPSTGTGTSPEEFIYDHSNYIEKSGFDLDPIMEMEQEELLFEEPMEVNFLQDWLVYNTNIDFEDDISNIYPSMWEELGRFEVPEDCGFASAKSQLQTTKHMMTPYLFFLNMESRYEQKERNLKVRFQIKDNIVSFSDDLHCDFSEFYLSEFHMSENSSRIQQYYKTKINKSCLKEPANFNFSEDVEGYHSIVTFKVESCRLETEWMYQESLPSKLAMNLVAFHNRIEDYNSKSLFPELQRAAEVMLTWWSTRCKVCMHIHRGMAILSRLQLIKTRCLGRKSENYDIEELEMEIGTLVDQIRVILTFLVTEHERWKEMNNNNFFKTTFTIFQNVLNESLEIREDYRILIKSFKRNTFEVSGIREISATWDFQRGTQMLEAILTNGFPAKVVLASEALETTIGLSSQSFLKLAKSLQDLQGRVNKFKNLQTKIYDHSL